MKTFVAVASLSHRQNLVAVASLSHSKELLNKEKRTTNHSAVHSHTLPHMIVNPTRSHQRWNCDNKRTG